MSLSEGMEVKVVREDQKRLDLEILDADQSVLQIIQQELLADERVEFAATNKPHPLLNRQTMSLIVKEGKPRKAFQAACDKALAKAKELEDSVVKTLQENVGG